MTIAALSLPFPPTAPCPVAGTAVLCCTLLLRDVPAPAGGAAPEPGAAAGVAKGEEERQAWQPGQGGRELGYNEVLSLMEYRTTTHNILQCFCQPMRTGHHFYTVHSIECSST